MKKNDAQKGPTEIARVCRALSVESRVKIVQALGERCLCVGALANLLEISAAAVSQHLRILRDAGLLVPKRSGLFMHYEVPAGVWDRLKKLLEPVITPHRRKACEHGKACHCGKHHSEVKESARPRAIR